MNHHRPATLRAHAAPRHRHLYLRMMHIARERYLVMPLGATIALIWANTASEGYFRFAHSLSFVVNEIAMALFFALIAQEVFEAMMPGGALHSWRRWSMPIVTAAGGLIGAVGIYLLVLLWYHESRPASAWPVVCAIDAASTFYVLKTIRPRSAALPFAVLIAIVSDIFGVLVVAPRYVVLQTRVGGAALVIAALVLAAVMRALKVRTFTPYLLLCGTALWVAFYWEELHPAFSLIPIVPFMPHEPRQVDVFAEAKDDDRVHHAEHEWHLLVQPIVFLFALVNAGVLLGGRDTGTWAVLAAALVGRPLGMAIAITFGLAAGLHLPRNLGWRELIVIMLATSSGFLIALFFATGSLATGPVLTATKLGIILSASGSVLALAAARALKIGRFAR